MMLKAYVYTTVRCYENKYIYGDRSDLYQHKVVVFARSPENADKIIDEYAKSFNEKIPLSENVRITFGRPQGQEYYEYEIKDYNGLANLDNHIRWM